MTDKRIRCDDSAPETCALKQRDRADGSKQDTQCPPEGGGMTIEGYKSLCVALDAKEARGLLTKRSARRF